MKLTIRHYYDFGADRPVVGNDLVRSEAWDSLRTRTSGPFALPETRAELDRLADERTEIAERARLIDAWLEREGFASVASYGSGVALLELSLHRLRPERRLTLTDYAPATVERLRALLPELDVKRHDLLADRKLDADVHLFHRIDTEFTDKQWRHILRRFADVPILVVATEVIDIRRALTALGGRFRNADATRAGWIRTRASFESLWRATHHAIPLRLHDLEGWALEPRTPRRA